MSQPYYPAEPSPDPFERFPLYSPPAEQAEPDLAPPLPVQHQELVQVRHQELVPAGPSLPGGLAVTDEQAPNTTVTVIAWVVAVVTGLYMLPWAIAATRGKANQWAIFAGNLLLGWTVVGWIVALVKSLGAHRPLYPVQSYLAITAGPVAPAATPGWYPDPEGRGLRYWDGRSWTAHRAG